MTRDEFKAKLDRLGELSQENDEVMEILAEINTDRDEMEGREVYGQTDVFDSDGVRWSEKYDNMRRRYRERFFSSPEEAKEDQIEDIDKDDDSTVMTFDALFDEREGDYENKED